MAATRPLTICDVYDRFRKGKKVPESDWDYTIIPQNATALKEKYKLNFGSKVIPEDEKTKNDLFQAGLEMLVSTGFYNQDSKCSSPPDSTTRISDVS
jgi:methylamine--corrinoid protein Co-methyltransferase